MGLRTNIDLSVQFGQDNTLTDLLFSRDMQSLLDTLDHGVSHVVTLDAGESNYVVSMGDVELARLIYIESDGEFTLTLGGGVSTQAIMSAAGGSYPTGFTGVDTLALKIDAVTISVTFDLLDQTVQQVINRLNAEAALLSFQAVAYLNGAQLRLKSPTFGVNSKVEIVSASAGVLTALGLTVSSIAGDAAVSGTGPIQVRRPASTNSATLAEGVKAFFLGTVQTGALTIDNPDPDNEIQLRIAIAGDLSPTIPC